MKFKFYALKLCAVIILIFILQLLIKGFTEKLVLNQDSYTELWRFATAIFLHADIMHLSYNMLALALFGSILESIIGGKKFLIVFFTSGILANIIAVNFYSSSLGASGAIYGVIGALTVIKPFLVVWGFGLPMPMFLASVFWATGDILGLFIPSNTGNIAHLAGIFFGIALGLIFRKREIKAKKENVILHEPSIRRWEDFYFIARDRIN